MMDTLPSRISVAHASRFSAGEPVGDTTALGRKIVFLLVIGFAGLAAGFLTVFLPAVVVYGLVLSGLFVLAVMRWPFFGLVLYTAIYFLRIGEMYPSLAPLRLERLMGALTLLSVLLAQLHRHGRLFFDASRQTKHFLYLIVAAALSVPFAYWRAGAAGGVVDFVKLLIFYLLVVHLVDTRRKFRFFVTWYGMMILYIALTTFVDYLHGSLLHTAGIDRAVGATSAGGGPNEMGATMATTIPPVVLLIMHRPLAKWRWLLLTVLGLLLVTMALTGSRAALVGLVGGLAYVWWHTRYRAVTGAVGLLLLVAGFAALPQQYKGRYSSMADASGIEANQTDRLHVWLKGLNMAIHRPITGVGIHCFGTANAMDYSTGPRASWLESHSLYVQVPAEMGFVGAWAFFSFLWVFVRLNRYTAKMLAADGDEDWSLEVAILNGIFVGTLVLLITSVFGHSLMRETWYLYAAFGLCLWRIYTTSHPSALPRSPVDVARLRQAGSVRSEGTENASIG